MGSVSMTLPQAGLWILALLTAPAFSQERQKGSKARFDKILQQFGFSQQEKGGWQETEGRRNFVAEIAGPKLEPGPVSGRDLLQRLQEGALDKTEIDANERRQGDKKELSGQQRRLPKEDALAKLFSVAKDETHSYKLKTKKKKNKSSKEGKLNRAGLSKGREGDGVGNIQKLTLGLPAIGDKIQRVNQKLSVTSQTPRIT